MKTHLFFDFNSNDTGLKELTSTIHLPTVVRDVKFIELADYSPTAVFFVFSCDIAESFSNDEERPILSFRLSGTGETQMVPVDPCKSEVRELTIRMFHRDNALISSTRQSNAGAHVILHSGLEMRRNIEMKAKYFMLKVTSVDETDKIHSITYRLAEPIFNAKYLKILNWFSSGGTDYVTSSMIEPTIINDPLVKEPIVAFGVGGVSKKHEPMKLINETLNEVSLSIQRVGGSKFHRSHSFIQFCILYD